MGDHERAFSMIGISRLSALHGFSDIRPLGGGLEFLVYRAHDKDGRDVVLRLSEQRYQSNANDQHVDTRELLQQEFAICRYLQSYDVPVPKPIDLILGNGPDDADIMVSEFIEDDETVLDSLELGRLLQTLHNVEPPDISFYATHSQAWASAVVTRLRDRWLELSKLTNLHADGPDLSELGNILNAQEVKSILHMDARRSNLRCRDGQITAFV